MWALTNDGVTSTPVLVAGDVGGVGGTDGDDTIVGMTTTLSQDADWSKKSRGKKCLLIRKQRYSWEINRLYNGRKEILCFCTETLFKHNFFLTSCGHKVCDYCRKMINQRKLHTPSSQDVYIYLFILTY